MRRRHVILVSIAALLIGGWLLAPRIAVWSMVLATKKGEESSQAARDRIVFFGERAIQPTIASIEEHSPWVRRYCYLPSALQKIGGSAHQDLLAAIDQQYDPEKRAHLISALQSAFDDYSRLDTIIHDHEAGTISKIAFFFMESGIRRSFPDAPELLTEGQTLNSAFTAYWKKRSEQDMGRQPAAPQRVGN